MIEPIQRFPRKPGLASLFDQNRKFAVRQKKLLEVKREHAHFIHETDGDRPHVLQLDPQQRAAEDIMTCSVLDQELDVSGNIRTFLDFIKEYQRLAAVQLSLGERRQLHKDVFFILNVLEYPLGAFVLQEVDLNEIIIMRLGKMLDDKGLADLSCTID